MSRPVPRPPLVVTLTVATLVAVCGFMPGAAAQDSRPNVVLMFPDNLGVGEVGVYGGAQGVPTPNIDRIAAEGMRLARPATRPG